MSRGTLKLIKFLNYEGRQLFSRPRAKSFSTSLMADLHQDLNRVSSFSRCSNGILLEGITPLRNWYINPNEKSNKYKSSLPS